MSDRFIEAPSAWVVGRTEDMPCPEWLESWGAPGFQHTSDKGPERIIELAGRGCYRSYASPRPGGTQAYIKHIIEVGHGSVLEHAAVSLAVRGISRSCSAELIRHKAGTGVSELSQRFVDLADTKFVIPPKLLAGMRMVEGDGDPWVGPPRHREWHPEAMAYDAWKSRCLESLDAYESVVGRLTESDSGRGQDRGTSTDRRKRIREAARSVLPGCTETALVFTGNLRAWRNIIEQRCTPQADAEIRRLCCLFLKLVSAEAPLLFEDYSLELLPDGTYHATTPHRKI